MTQHRPLSRETLAAIKAGVRSGMESLRAETPQRLSDWARAEFRLAGESSHQKGAWEAWPFQIGWMDAFSNDDIEHVDVQKSKRVGYTKTLVAFCAYNVAHRRRKQALWQPTDDDRDSFVKSEIEPAFSQVPAVLRARKQGKGAEDTIKYKPFRDSAAHFLGGKAARAYRRITVAAAMLDELSGFDQQIEKSADPLTLARGRLEGAPYPKLVCGSTPRLKGLCHIERTRLNADADLRYHITCPHCHVEHPLIWGGEKVAHGFKWTRGQPETVRHVCPHCRESITQGDYLRAWVGAWVCIKTGLRYGADQVWRNAAGEPARPPRHVAFMVWAAYSPQRGWDDIVREFEESLDAMRKGDTGPLQGFVNETLAETWEIKGERAEGHALQERAESFPLAIVPKGVLELTAGIDVQGNRWEIGIWGWARGLESWTIAHEVIEGNPADESDWEMVEAVLMRRFPQAWRAGASLPIAACSIDSGHHTDAVYHFARKMAHRMRIHAVKGASEPHKPIKGTASSQDVNWRGQKIPHGVKLWVIGSDTAKDLLHGQLQIVDDGPGKLHFSNELQREWYEQLTAEQRITVKTPTGLVERWVKRRPRNEVLDCRSYALHAAYMLGLHTRTEAQWARVESAVQPPADLFTIEEIAQPRQEQVQEPQAAPQRFPPQPPQRVTFARQW